MEKRMEQGSVAEGRCESPIKTPDTKTAAYLVAVGHRVEGMSGDGRRWTFHFSDTPEVRAALEDYRFGAALVEARRLYDAQQQLKSLMFDRPVYPSRR